MVENQSIEQKMISIEHWIMKQNLLQKEILSFSEACAYLNTAKSYLYKLTSTRQVPYYRPTGKRLFFKKSELDQWVLSNRCSTEAEIQKSATNYVITNRRA